MPDEWGDSISGYGWTNDGVYPYWPRVQCLHCGKFVGRDGIFNYETWEMTSEVSSLDAEHRHCHEAARERVRKSA